MKFEMKLKFGLIRFEFDLIWFDLFGLFTVLKDSKTISSNTIINSTEIFSVEKTQRLTSWKTASENVLYVVIMFVKTSVQIQINLW